MSFQRDLCVPVKVNKAGGDKYIKIYDGHELALNSPRSRTVAGTQAVAQSIHAVE